MLTSALPLAGILMSEGRRRDFQDALQENFQDTGVFRDYLSSLMNQFIAMGAGGPLDGSYYSYDSYSGDIIGAVAVTQVTEGSGWSYKEPEYEFYPGLNGVPTQADRERWKKEAEAWDRRHQEDKNILYRIEKWNKNTEELVYTNVPEGNSSLNLSVPTYSALLHEGYSFVLSFEWAPNGNGAGKCAAKKDGQDVDLYGDGIYVEDGRHWNLPGYDNFPAGDETRDVRVTIAVADAPRLYVKSDYSASWSSRESSWIYWTYQSWLKDRRNLALNAPALLGAGLILMVLYLILRRGKAQADRAIAGLTGKLWFEFKVLLLLAVVILVLLPMTEEMRFLVEEAAYAFQADGYYGVGAGWFFGQYISELLRQPAALLGAFWVCYLFVNDLRYGDKPWRHGIFGMLSARGLKLPLQKRLSRRLGIMGLGLMLLGAEIIFFLILQTLRAYLPRWAIWNLFLLPLLLVFGLYLWYLRRQTRLASDLGLLTDQITAVRQGELSAPLSLPEDSDLRRAAEELTDIQHGIRQAVEEQTRSERMKVELVTNVSHDLKTPLTSIISYTELLKQEKLEPPAGEYVEILTQKAERLRSMVLDVFEISKAASGELPVKLVPLDLAKLLRQTVGDMEERISAAPVTLRQSLPEEPVIIVADGDRLYRVFQNLLQNALQYALEGSRVYLSLTVKDGTALASVKNTSRLELADGVDYTARFVRGDQSRTDGGSGLGLAIAESFTAACGGILKVEPVADLFVVSACFPLLEETLPSQPVSEEDE